MSMNKNSLIASVFALAIGCSGVVTAAELLLKQDDKATDQREKKAPKARVFSGINKDLKISDAATNDAQLPSTGLNAMGAIVAGNEEGTIPPWEGGLPRKDLPEFGSIPNPFADEKPLFSINHKNMDLYADKLTEGQKYLLNKYPGDYFIPIYPTHRTASYPDFVYSAMNHNRANATVVMGEKNHSSVIGSKIAAPFPEPQTGLEAIWNHLMRWRGIYVKRENTFISVSRQGRFNPLVIKEEFAIPYASPDALHQSISAQFPQVKFAYKQKFISPGRVAGNGSLAYESFDYINYDSVHWQFLKGVRRVVRMPKPSPDAVLAHTDGIVHKDDLTMFRGSPELFNWTIEGRVEMYIPYNAYMLKDHEYDDYDDLVDEHFLRPKRTRYELHRVWKVVGEVADDKKSIYSKRVFYIDEDSWTIVMSEKYNQKGELAQYSEAHLLNYYQVPVMHFGAITHYRFDDGRYAVSGLNNLQPRFEWGETFNYRSFGAMSLQNYVR